MSTKQRAGTGMSTDLAVIEAALAELPAWPWPVSDRQADWLRETAAELLERVKAAEARALPEPGSGCICEWYSEDRGGGYHETMQEYDPACPEHSQHVYNPRTGVWEFPNAAEATIARVRALAEEHPGTAWNSGLNLRQALRDALGGTPTDATEGDSSADDERNRFSGEDTDEPTQPILRPTDQRYEPPAVDDCGGCCR